MARSMTVIMLFAPMRVTTSEFLLSRSLTNEDEGESNDKENEHYERTATVISSRGDVKGHT